jgi:DNA-binding response OmpR family regulator
LTVPKQSKPAKARILLIEDEPAVARITELVLVNAGFEVDVETKHSDAAELINAGRYDLVISDTLGPRASGLEGLRPIVQAASCPVLLFSAHRFPALEVESMGFAGMIKKPFDIDELLRAIEDRLPAGGPADEFPSGAVN